MSAGFHEIRITQKELTKFKSVTLDGKELMGVVSVNVDMARDSLTRVTLEMYTDDCELHLKEPMDIEEEEEESPTLYAWDEPVYIEKYEGKKD